MDRQTTGRGRSMTWVILVLAAVAIAAGAYYYSEQISGDRGNPAPPPSAEWTTAPEDGVKVNLPQTPMTNVPVASPAAGEPDEAQGEAR